MSLQAAVPKAPGDLEILESTPVIFRLLFSLVKLMLKIDEDRRNRHRQSVPKGDGGKSGGDGGPDLPRGDERDSDLREPRRVGQAKGHEPSRRNVDASGDEKWESRGFDPYGIHRDTETLYDPDGFDIHGYDQEGYDRKGYDFQGYNRRGSRRGD